MMIFNITPRRIKNNTMKKLLSLLILSTFVISCDSRISTVELEKEVRQSIIETLAENPESEGVEVVNFNLVHKGGNEYKGLLELKMPNYQAEITNTFMSLLIDEGTKIMSEDKVENKYSVDVIYDGESYSWEIITE